MVQLCKNFKSLEVSYYLYFLASLYCQPSDAYAYMDDGSGEPKFDILY